MAGINFNQSFDWLGQLVPGALERQRRDETRQSLSDLKSGDADSLIAAGTKLLPIDPKQGLALIAEGRQRKAIDLRADELSAWRIGGSTGTPNAGTAAPSSVPSGIAFPKGVDPNTPYTPGAPPPAPRGPDPFAAAPSGAGAGNVGVPGPQSSLPPLAGQAAAAIESPSNDIIAAAQGGTSPSPAFGPQLAGPLPPSTGGSAPLAPQVPGAEMLQGAMARPTVTQPPGGVPGPAPAEPSSAAVGRIPPNADLEAERQRIMQEMARTHPKNVGVMRALSAQLADVTNRGKLSKEEKAYTITQGERMAAGQPVQTWDEWNDRQKNTESIYKETAKRAEEVEGLGIKSADTARKLEVMSKIVSNPNFIAGTSGTWLQKGSQLLSGIYDAAKAAGWDPEQVFGIKKADIPGMSSAQLTENFTALSNKLIFDTIGTLGNAISEGDRSFMERANPSMLATKEGTQILIEIMKKTAERAQAAGRVSQAYRTEKGASAEPWVLNKRLQDYGEQNSFFTNKDGSLNELGKRLQALEAPTPVPGSPGAEALKPPPPPAPTHVDPGTTVYKGGKPYRLNPDGSVTPLAGAT